MVWNLLALLFLVTVVTATDRSLFLRLCSDGECPPGWRNIDGDCAMFVSGWDRAAGVQEGDGGVHGVRSGWGGLCQASQCAGLPGQEGDTVRVRQKKQGN